MKIKPMDAKEVLKNNGLDLLDYKDWDDVQDIIMFSNKPFFIGNLLNALEEYAELKLAEYKAQQQPPDIQTNENFENLADYDAISTEKFTTKY